MQVLVNWLWQGAALTLVADVALRGASRASASTRYALWWAVMMLVLLLPALQWLVSISGAATASADIGPAISAMPLPDVPQWPLVAGLSCWALWVLAWFARLAGSLAALARVRRNAVPFPAEREARLRHWRSVQGSGMRAARLVTSHDVPSASVIGFGPAFIAVAPRAAKELTDEELDHVVLHEWAHVQRRDDYARLAQVLIRGVAGLHPAVWWIGRRLEIEREIACDDYTVNVTGGARRLALCLTKLAELQQSASWAFVAPGAVRTSQLAVRVRRLLDPRRNTSTRRAYAVLGGATLALAILAGILADIELVVASSPAVAPIAGLPVNFSLPTLVTAVPTSPDDRIARQEQALSPVMRRVSASSDAETDGSGGRTKATAPSAPSADIQAGEVEAVRLDRLDRGDWQVPELPSLSTTRPEIIGAPLVRPHGNDQEAITTPWGAAADAGISIGRGSQKAATATADAGTSVGKGSQKAAVATAGFFTRLSRKIASSF